MLTNISIAFALMLIAASLVQWGIAVWFRRKFVRTKNECVAASQPSAAVIMSVRGCDPSLRESLLGVIDQTLTNSCHLQPSARSGEQIGPDDRSR